MLEDRWTHELSCLIVGIGSERQVVFALEV